jgi:hypothetical protein
MYTRFASVGDFIKAVQTDTRHPDEIKDETLRWPVGEYRLWLTDTDPERKPLEEDLRDKLEHYFARIYRPSRPRAGRVIIQGHGQKRRRPNAAWRHLFELFEIDLTKPV